MDLARYFSTRRKEQHGHGHSSQRPRLPLLASPVNEDVRELMSSDGSLDLEKMNTDVTTNTTDTTSTIASNWKTSSGNPIIYRKHHEASTIELFYDMFFVANLAYFTAMHQHTDATSLINYLKLFTLMWFTWLSTTLYDVRFSIDCVWSRIHKAVQFGVMTGFVFAGPVFDSYDKSDDRKAYKNFALVLVVSRFAVSLQYFVVMWQGRMFRQTLLPVGLSGLVHLCTATVFLVTHFVFPKGAVTTSEQVAWFVIAIIEGLLIFLIAMVWRIVSFKYTHLVERLQLLTLIIIGEGIIGMVKSVACITKGQSQNNSTEIGTVVAAVILLYLMWMLYFDQLSHDRFGTVRQQMWSLLHYPLHMAILLCVEGNTSLIVWNSAVQALKWIWYVMPADYSNPAAGFTNTDDFIAYLNKTMYDINARFKSKQWNTTYYWDRNFTAIRNYTDLYGFQTDEWNNKTGNVVRFMFNKGQVFVFEAHADTLAKLNAVVKPNSNPRMTLEAVYDVHNVTVLQFYIGAGAMLLLLAIMYWFNKLHKTKYEFGEMINRTVVGFGLIIVGVGVVLVNKSTTGFKFVASNWIIPIVVFCFMLVLILDNILLTISHYNARRNRSSSSHHRHASSWAGTTINDDSDTSNLISKVSVDEARSLASPPIPAPYTNIGGNTAYHPYSYPPSVSSQSIYPPSVHSGQSNYPPESQPHTRDFGSNAGVGSQSRRNSDTSGITIQDPRNSNTLSVSRPASPNSMGRGHGIDVAVTPPTPAGEFADEAEQRARGSKKERRGGYESVDVEDDYEREGYEQHPMRVRTVRQGF